MKKISRLSKHSANSAAALLLYGTAFFLFLPVCLASNDDIEKAQTAYFSGNLKEAFSNFKPLADTGNPEAQYYLGLIYSDDRWEEKNIEKSLAYLFSAADQNHSSAMWQIGQAYDSGTGVEKNLLTAIDWYRKSKNAEEPGKTKLLYYRNKDSEPLESNPQPKIIQTLLSQANSGDVEAQAKLAAVYDTGQLVKQDLSKAFKWYEQAAKNGNEHAQFMAGYFYCRGLSVPANPSKANYWLKKSRKNTSCNGNGH